jgi:hypothetical protein
MPVRSVQVTKRRSSWRFQGAVARFVLPEHLSISFGLVLVGSLTLEEPLQTLIQVFGNGSGSLRDRVVNDPRLEEYDLYVAAYKKQYRRMVGRSSV